LVYSKNSFSLAFYLSPFTLVDDRLTFCYIAFVDSYKFKKYMKNKNNLADLNIRAIYAFGFALIVFAVVYFLVLK